MPRNQRFVTGIRRDARQTFAPLTAEQRELVEKNYYFLLFYLKKLVFDKELYLEEAKSIGALAMMRAAKTWTPEGGASFCGYATWWIRNYVVREIHWMKRIAEKEFSGHFVDNPLDGTYGDSRRNDNEFVDENPLCTETVIAEEQLAKVRLALGKLGRQERRLLQRVFYGGEEHAAMARDEGVTRACISLRVKKAIKNLRREYMALTPETV